MKWARYRFQKVTGPQKWRWEWFGDNDTKEQIDAHYEEKCSEEAAMYERGARIEWEIETPSASVIEAEEDRLAAEIKRLIGVRSDMSKFRQRTKLMSEKKWEKLKAEGR